MDYYSILGVSKTATQDEIKRAYRKLAGQHHPDKGGSKEKFQEIQSAYDTLSDVQRRQHYDTFGNQPHGGPHMGQGGFHFDFGNSSFEDIFSAFGINRGARRQTYSAIVILDLEQVANGGNKTIGLNFPQGQKMINVTIPRGVDDGDHVRYNDIVPDVSVVLQFRIQPHPVYTRKGLDLHQNISLNMLHFITGTVIKVKDIYDKELEISIAPKTKINTTLRCVQHGLRSDRGVGDLYLSLSATLPEKISDDLLLAIQNELKGNNDAK